MAFRAYAITSLWITLLFVGLLGIYEGRAAGETGWTRTNSGGGVTVAATYLNPGEAKEIRFKVALNTHSVDLDAYDLKALSLLRDETGKSYQPTRVEKEGSGHHIQVTLVFPKPSPAPKRLELVIKGVAKVKERTFRWDAKQ